MSRDRLIRYYEMQLERRPQERFFIPLADLYRQDGRLADAATLLEQGLARNADSLSARVVLARVRREQGRVDVAQALYSKVLAVDPEHREAPGALAELAGKPEQPETEAREEATSASEAASPAPAPVQPASGAPPSAEAETMEESAAEAPPEWPAWSPDAATPAVGSTVAPEAGVETEAGLEPETGVETEAAQEPEAEVETEAAPEPETGVETEAAQEPETGAETETAQEPEAEAARETDALPEAEPPSVPATRSTTESWYEPEAGDEPEAAAFPEPEPGPPVPDEPSGTEPVREGEAVAAGAPALEAPDADAPSSALTDEAEVPSQFLTQTLADIYLSQGHRQKALDILRRLLARQPDREDVAAAIASLEADDAGHGEETPSGDDPDRSRFEAWLDRHDVDGGSGA